MNTSSRKTKFFVWEYGIPGGWFPVFYTERPDMSGSGHGVSSPVKRFGLREVPMRATLNEVVKLLPKPTHDPWEDKKNLKT